MKRKNFSSKRAAIYNAICNTELHPSAGAVYESLKQDFPDLSLGTVYRNIALFKEEGLVAAVAVVDGEERIDGRVDPHPHFICKKCRRVIDVRESGEETLKNELEQDGFRIDSVGVTYYGICRDCCQASQK